MGAVRRARRQRRLDWKALVLRTLPRQRAREGSAARAPAAADKSDADPVARWSMIRRGDDELVGPGL
jgi:hypothetical protein